MSCLTDVTTWLANPSGNITDPEQIRILWDIDNIVYQNGTRGDLETMVQIWTLSRQVIIVFAFVMLVVYICITVLKAKCEQRMKRTNSKRKSSQTVALFSWSGITKPWLLKSPDKIFVMHFLGLISMCLYWFLGAGTCVSTRKAAAMCYGVCLGSQFHATSYYVLLIKQIVASSVNMAGNVGASKLDVFFGTFFPWFSLGFVALDILGTLPIRSYVDVFKGMLALYFVPALYNGVSVALFGKKAVSTLNVAISSSGGPTGGGKIAQLAAVKQRVTLIALFVLGSALTVCTIQLVLVFSQLMTTPIVNAVVLVYFTIVLLLYMAFGSALELKHIMQLKNEKSKIDTTNNTNGTSSGVSIIASEHRLQSTNVNLSGKNETS